MLVGFDTEFGYRRTWRLPNGRLHGDYSTMQPVCACLHFEDGRQLQLADHFEQLQDYFADPQYTFLVHGAHAEYGFCRRVGIRFPDNFIDTFLMGLLVVHAAEFRLVGGPYKNAALAEVAPRYGLRFIEADEKDRIRESIMMLTHMHDFGMDHVLSYCLEDAKATVELFPRLHADMLRLCGVNAERNLVELYQPYSLRMAESSLRGIRFDQRAWDRFLLVAPKYRDRRVSILQEYDYDHEGEGIGDRAFARLIVNLDLMREWPRTPTGRLSTKDDDLKLAAAKYAHPALIALHELGNFDDFMSQNLGNFVDTDGHIRCGILPLAQRSSRNSTVSPNLTGVPKILRPLLIPDEGCRFVHFDYSQQEPGVAGYLSGDRGLTADFSNGDVYTNLGLRLRLISGSTPASERRRIRNGILKILMLSIIYGKGCRSIARDMSRPYHDAVVLLSNLWATYPQLFTWLRSYVAAAMERGWAENIIGYRAAFNVPNQRERNHVARSCQNFPIQSSAAACFQLTGEYLGQFGSDIRLPLHDAYLINVLDDPKAIEEERQRITAATTHANSQLFPGLAVKRDYEVLNRFAKDGDEASLDRLIAELEDNS